MQNEANGEAGVGFQTSHAALLYESDREFLGATVPFLEEGFDAGIPAFVMLPHARYKLLDSHFGDSAGSLLSLVHVEDVGQNPAWIIPAFAEFASLHAAEGRAVRGVDEPIHPARTPAEVIECERHESLLDLALAGAASYDILCPYNVGELSPEAWAVAGRTHRHIHRDGARSPNPDYVEHIPAQLDAPLPPAPPDAPTVAFLRDDAWSIRSRVAARAAEAGLDGERLEDLAVVISEALSNSIEHGGGGGEIAWWSEGDRFVCEIRDRGAIADPLVGRVRPAPIRGNGRGMWLMHQLCDLVQIRVLPHDQKVIRLHLGW